MFLCKNCEGCKMMMKKRAKGFCDELPTDIISHISTFVCCKTCSKTRDLLNE